MISERLNNLLKVLIFAFLASGVALILLLQIQNYHRMQLYLATEAALPQHKPNGEVRPYKNDIAGFSFQYSSKLSISVSAGSVELSHQIPYKNSGECDMKGDGIIYDYLTDFRVNVFIAQGSLPQVVKQISPYIPEENFTGNTLKLNPGFIDSYQIDDLKGYSIYEGAEGCGHVIYYFPLSDSKVLVVKRNMVQQLSSAVTPEVNQDVLVTPGVINPGQADLIFNQILTTFHYQAPVITK